MARTAAALALVALAGCASMPPPGPSVMVLSTPKQLQGIAAFGLEITGYVAE